MGKAIHRLFSVAPARARFARLGFRGEPALVERLEGVAWTFLQGYHRALLEDGGAERLAAALDAEVAPEQRGFAYEGAGFGLALRDTVTPWRPSHLDALLDGPGRPWIHLIHVGAGWVIARPGVPVRRLLRRLHPLYGWLAIDGYGFHEGFFSHPVAVERMRVPRRLKGYARRAFDLGLGRSLWFSEVGDAERLIARIARFPASRRGDLWSGLGLATAYAGGVGRAVLERLFEAAGHHRPMLAQGAAFAAKARMLDGTLGESAELACAIYCGLSAREAGTVTDDALTDLPAEGAGGEPSFEVWRRRIQRTLVKEGLAA